MATITPATLKSLEALFVETIRETVPRSLRQRADRWKPYDEARDTATRMRMFRIVWGLGPVFKGGYFGSGASEVSVTLAVRTDYATAGQPNMLELIQDDWHQLRERLAALVADTSNGVTYVWQTDTPPTQVAETGQGRTRISSTSLASTPIAQVDLTYEVRYMKARAAA